MTTIRHSGSFFLLAISAASGGTSRRQAWSRSRLGRRSAVKYSPDGLGRSGQRAVLEDEGGTHVQVFSKTLSVATALLAMAWFADREAHALTYKDILGKWCSATARLDFS